MKEDIEMIAGEETEVMFEQWRIGMFEWKRFEVEIGAALGTVKIEVGTETEMV